MKELLITALIGAATIAAALLIVCSATLLLAWVGGEWPWLLFTFGVVFISLLIGTAVRESYDRTRKEQKWND